MIDYKQNLRELHLRVGRSEDIWFMMYGVVAGLIFAGVITSIPLIAIGVGFAYISGRALIDSADHYIKADKLKD